jgi:hypothetical protein
MRCEICQRNVPDDGVTLHRVNEKGVKGIWRCADHLTPDQRAAIDPEVSEIVKIIADDNRGRKC